MNRIVREPTHVYPGPGLVLLIDFLHAYHKAGCKKKNMIIKTTKDKKVFCPTR